MGELTHDAGEHCPEDLGQNDDGDRIECEQTLTLREHDFDPQLDDMSGEELEPEGPVKELICPVHGIIESV